MAFTQPAAHIALREAVHAALLADTALAVVLGSANRVFDEPRRQQSYPYVTIGEARLSAFGDGDDSALEHSLVLHGWSQQGGHREAHAIAGALLHALDDADLELDGHRLAAMRFTLADIRREADGRTYHVLVRFRAVTELAS